MEEGSTPNTSSNGKTLSSRPCSSALSVMAEAVRCDWSGEMKRGKTHTSRISKIFRASSSSRGISPAKAG